MSEDQQQPIVDFNRMWNELQKPMEEIRQQIASMSRQSARAEIAGAVEIVDSLPSAGQKGRILYLSTDDDLYYDTGSGWENVSAVPLPKRAVMWHMDSTPTNHSLATINNSSQWFNTYTYQSSASDGDNFTHSCILAAGTYTLYVHGLTDSSRGKVEWRINGTLVGTQDWYNGSVQWNQVKTIAGIVISTGGLVVVQGTINGKNASSSGYTLNLTRFMLKD